MKEILSGAVPNSFLQGFPTSGAGLEPTLSTFGGYGRIWTFDSLINSQVFWPDWTTHPNIFSWILELILGWIIPFHSFNFHIRLENPSATFAKGWENSAILSWSCRPKILPPTCYYGTDRLFSHWRYRELFFFGLRSLMYSLKSCCYLLFLG